MPARIAVEMAHVSLMDHANAPVITLGLLASNVILITLETNAKHVRYCNLFIYLFIFDFSL